MSILLRRKVRDRIWLRNVTLIGYKDIIATYIDKSLS